ncbi:MAG: eukaryotic-like serine/threonine-protein kinase [bacterium]
MPATEQRVALPSRYRVLRHIANGGMASVWAAEDELLGRLVAVKLLSRAYDSDDRARRRFLREARAAARLGDCRNVVTVYDIGEHEDRAFMVMEHFAGGTVADRLRRDAPVPRALALRWLHETAIALDCAHEHEVVHRDVKPANLLLDQRGRLAVGDFGIATVASEASVTQTGQVLGTAAYLSPEQARGQPATAASDRYALAVVAFELLTGTRPFTADHPAAQARAHVEATVPAASAAAEGLPPAVDAVLRRGMAKDPEARPSTAAELVDLIEEAVGDDAVAADPPTAPTRRVGPRIAPARRPATEARVPRTPTPPPGPPPAATGGAHRRSWLAALAALGALALAAGAVAAIALTGSEGGGTTAERTTAAERTGTATAQRSRTTTAQSAQQSQPRESTQQQTATQSQASTATQAAPPSSDPKGDNDRGFALLQQGDAAGAVTPLQRSVAGFRAQGRTGEIDYAFALFNLGNALRLTGNPGDAIPLLEERLQVSDYKRGIVERELALARDAAGGGDGSTGASAEQQAGAGKKPKRGDRGPRGDGDSGDD